MNKKGFTLFTALISLLLISVALGLIFNMINTENTYLSLIQDQSSMSDLMTIADLARADAFNTFIITLRSNWEEHMSNHKMYVYREQMDMNWSDFTEWFVKENFFEKNFPGYFAKGMLFNLKYKLNPPGYNLITETNTGTKLVCAEGCTYGQDDCECAIELIDSSGDSNNLFISVVVDMFKAGGEKVDIIDCNQSDNNCNGPFFLTLDTTKLADENYELLPIVTVLRTKSNQVIQRPVLSRQIYKIYIPWRGLQALRVSRNLVLGNESEKNENPATQSNTGFFSPTIHNTLEQARLGYCDPGTCVPRNNFFKTPDKTGSDNQYCHLIDKTLSENNMPLTLGIPQITGLGTYDLTSNESVSDPFLKLYSQTFNQTLVSRPGQTISYNSGLVMKGDPAYTSAEGVPSDINISERNVAMSNKISKKYVTNVAGKSVSYDYSVSFNNLQNIASVAGGLGLFLRNNKSANILLVNFDWYDTEYIKKINIIQDNQYSALLSCAELEQATISLEFEETDSRYLIKKEYKGTSTKINIEIVDNYSGFYFTPGNTPPSWSPLTTTTNSYLDPANVNLLNSNLDGKDVQGNDLWTCYSQVAGSASQTCGPEKQSN